MKDKIIYLGLEKSTDTYIIFSKNHKFNVESLSFFKKKKQFVENFKFYSSRYWESSPDGNAFISLIENRLKRILYES